MFDLPFSNLTEDTVDEVNLDVAIRDYDLRNQVKISYINGLARWEADKY